ncbi:MAG TPA: CRTAC1 family protein [Bauldia sp.]|nr:CRTAC1 family protein [Bauldia sp.]
MRHMFARGAILVLALAGLHGAATAEPAPLVPTFVEETQSAGIDSVYAGEWQYMVGGGVATFDCNDDGFPDMLLAGGDAPAKFYVNRSTRGGPLKFALQKSGLELDAVTGAYPIDVDSDGIADVVLLRVGESAVMRGLGNCRFERANAAWNFDGGDAWATAFAAEWEHGATWPTMAIGTYIDRTQEIEPWGTCTDNWLLRPKAAGGPGFGPRIPLKPSYCALSMLFTDWNRSGTPALRVSNDREYYLGGQEQLWRLDPGQPPSPYTARDGWKPLKIWGMGIAATDINGDGYPDFFLTSMADNKLQTFTNPPADGQAKPDYKDIALARNVIAQHPYTGSDVRPSTAWHAQFEDVNNDGRADLFIAKGNVSRMPDFANDDPNNLLLQGADGKFVEAGDKAGVASMANSRGAGLPDFNLDGLPDLVVVNRWQSAQVWRNVTKGAGNWVEVRLRQDGPNRDGIGAWIEMKCGADLMRKEVTIGGGHASGELGWIHFGLADATLAEVRITWPDGTVGDWQQLGADEFYTLERGKPPQVWAAR